MSAIIGPHGETRYFSEPLVHLADHNPAFKNIYMPSSEFGVASTGITAQFLESAEFYHSKYTSDERSAARQLEYTAILSKYGYAGGVPLNILDIGAGSGGNTFIPLARMFPGSDYIATDLSPNLLSILQYSTDLTGVDCNLICVCTDASKTPMHADTFDLVVGSSILHHLIEPQEVLKRVHTVLKPGGVALFFEPFEKGHAVVALAFRHILRISRSGRPLDSRVEKALEDMLLDWSVRVGRDKSAEFYNYIDDKWLFTENFLNEIGSSIGFDPLLMMKRSGDAKKFTRFVENVLNLHSSLPRSVLPEWAWNIVEEIDNTISYDLSADLHIEDWFSLQKRRDSSR